METILKRAIPYVLSVTALCAMLVTPVRTYAADSITNVSAQESQEVQNQNNIDEEDMSFIFDQTNQNRHKVNDPTSERHISVISKLSSEDWNYQSVPNYYQDDYPDVAYGGSGTIETSGCSITCLAMVATYLTDKEYLPDYFAYRYGQPEYIASYGDYIGVMEQASEDLGLDYQGRKYSLTEIVDELKQGKLVIAMMTDQSLFTSYGHFIVLTGVTEDGKILVNDPNKWNYSKKDLKDGFKNGFDWATIEQGFGGGLVFGGKT